MLPHAFSHDGVTYVVSFKPIEDQWRAALYQRDPERFRELLARTVEIHERLHREWPTLARHYREALGAITSPEAWEGTLGLGGDEA